MGIDRLSKLVRDTVLAYCKFFQGFDTIKFDGMSWPYLAENGKVASVNVIFWNGEFQRWSYRFMFPKEVDFVHVFRGIMDAANTYSAHHNITHELIAGSITVPLPDMTKLLMEATSEDACSVSEITSEIIEAKLNTLPAEAASWPF